MKKILIVSVALLLGACMSTDPYTGNQKVSNTAKGAGIGALAGAVIGAATSSSDDRKKDHEASFAVPPRGSATEVPSVRVRLVPAGIGHC